MGTMSLAANMKPDDKITRQEAFSILARAFQLEATDPNYSALNAFQDKDDIESWAKESICAFVEKGVLHRALVGMSMSSSDNAVKDITLKGTNSIMGSGSVGGIIGSAQDTDITHCSVDANIIMTAASNGAGILGGGIEGGIISGCSATGTVTAIASGKRMVQLASAVFWVVPLTVKKLLTAKWKVQRLQLAPMQLWWEAYWDTPVL